jgi:hypothetical protein
MTRRDWWLGVVVVTIAVLLHALPRYQRPVEVTPPARASSVPGLDAPAEPGGVEIQVPLSDIKSEPLGTGGVRVTAQKIVNRPAAPCALEGAVRPRSGAELGGKQDRRDSGKLQIDNRTGWDAVATLVEDSDGTPRRAIFIRNGALGLITSVPSGRYRLRFQARCDWPVGRRSCRHADTSEIDEALDVRKVSSGSGRGSATYHVTLHKHVASTITGVAVPAASSGFCIS